MTSGFLSKGLFGGLAFRVLLFLSLALLPIGLIAVVQNREIASQTQEAAELSLIAVTEQASTSERTAIEKALGAAEALASVIRLVRDDPEVCSTFLRAYKQASEQYRIVGYINELGMMECSSEGQGLDFSGPNFDAIASDPQRVVFVKEVGATAGESFLLANFPVIEGGEFLGLISISLDRETVESELQDTNSVAPASIITYNQNGAILTADLEPETVQSELPMDYELSQLTASKRQVFVGQNRAGEERVFAVVPLVSGALFSLSSWDADTPLLETDFSGNLSSLLPFFMWAASLVVAFWALNRLAIRHISKLGRQMRHFALNRTLPRRPLGGNVPNEIVSMEEAFLGMADSILQDEARLEDSLREKNILLKEVHHRVKNNLQLISSIMNMQIRQAPTEANRRVLQRLQDRILSLATVHKSLYQGDEMISVDGGLLIEEIVSRNLAVGLSGSAGIKVDQDYDNIMIGPDDAAPLTLLVSEAVTNALKHTPQDRPGEARIEISLKYIGKERALLRVANTIGGNPQEDGTGLGSRLIHAFSRQLNGDLDIVEEGETYMLQFEFPVPQKEKAVIDY